MGALFEELCHRKRVVIASFSRVARYYEGVARVQKKAAAFLAERILTHAEQGAQIVEFGAGTGFLTRLLLRGVHDSRVTAVDCSSAMLEELYKNLSEEEKKRVVLCAEDMDGWSEKGSFSISCSSFALQWSRDPLAQIARTNQWLAPGGIVAHLLPIRGSLRSLQERGFLCKMPQLDLSMEQLVNATQSLELVGTGSFDIEENYATPMEALRGIRAFGGAKGPPLAERLFAKRKDVGPVSCEWCLGWVIARKR